MATEEAQDIAPPTDDFFNDEKARTDEAHPEVPNPEESEEVEEEPVYGGPWLEEEERKIWGPKVYDVPEPEEEGE